MPDYSQHSDLQLVSLLREGRPAADNAFSIIYFKYTPRLFGYCLYKAGSREEAEEILQDTWLRFFNAAKSGKAVDNILPYLFSIAKNICIDKFRSNSARRRADINYIDMKSIEQLADPYNLQKEMERDEFAGLVKLAVSQLDDIYKDAVTLYWFGNLNFDEIAAVCGETEACIRTRVARAFKQLAVILKPYMIEP